jgi:hypothetical protein
MNSSLTLHCALHFSRQGRGGPKQLCPGHDAQSAPAIVRVARLARLMALALRFDKLVRTGEIADYAQLARLGQVTRARISQIMNLLHLAPDIQEEILFLNRPEVGRDPFHLAPLQAIAAKADWPSQRRRWRHLRRQAGV